MNGMILACDFGGTKLSAAVVETAALQQPSLIWHKHLRQSSPKGATAVTDIEMMVRMGHELLMGKRPFAVGISFGGPVDYKTGVVRLSHHVPGWENVPLRQRFAEEFNAPAYVDNDANVAALGEYRFGAGRGTFTVHHGEHGSGRRLDFG